MDPGAFHGRSEKRPCRQTEQADQDRRSEGAAGGGVRGGARQTAPLLPRKAGMDMSTWSGDDMYHELHDQVTPVRVCGEALWLVLCVCHSMS